MPTGITLPIITSKSVLIDITIELYLGSASLYNVVKRLAARTK
jgi:hypothetical protein